MILGCDVSGWNSLKTPYAALKTAGVAFCIVKGDQSTSTANHVALARDAGMVVGEYFWHDPTFAPSRQAADFLDDCKINNPDFVFLDVEQWWANWGKWQQWIGGKITKNQVPITPKGSIASHARTVMQLLTANLKIPVGIYTGAWFVDSYAPGIASWAAEYPVWIANYIQETIHEATWAEIAAGPPADFKPAMPRGMTTWLMWQWSSHKIMPKFTDRIDLNVFDGTLDAFRSWAGLQAPEPTLAERVVSLEARVARLEAGTGEDQPRWLVGADL